MSVTNEKVGHRVHRRIREGATVSVLAILAATALTRPAMAQQSAASGAVAGRHVTFNIGPQDLNGAVRAFADKTGMRLSYDGPKVRGLRSGGATCDLTPRGALGRILAGTGLSYRVTGPNAVSLERLPTDQVTAEAMMLPGIQVEGAVPTGYGPLLESDRVDDPKQAASVSKTGTKLEDLPANVQIIPHAVLAEQGTSMLRQSLYNASGVNVGGQDTKGFYDHFLIRGLNAQVFEDGFSDGDQLGGFRTR